MLADNSREISCLFSKLRKMSQNVSSAAVVIGALRVNKKNSSYIKTSLIMFELKPKIAHHFGK